jgi:hypothetical protein
MVTHMAILQHLYSAVKSCKDGNANEGVTNLDTAVAYYTGSFEGTEDGGSFDGSLNFFLARRMCIYFETCSESNNALINERMISLFYSAQGELDTKVSMVQHDYIRITSTECLIKVCFPFKNGRHVFLSKEQSKRLIMLFSFLSSKELYLLHGKIVTTSTTTYSSHQLKSSYQRATSWLNLFSQLLPMLTLTPLRT